MDSDEWVVALVGSGLKMARDATVGLGELGATEAAGYLLVDLAHAQVALGTIVCEWNVPVSGEELHGAFIFRVTLAV